MKSKLPLSLVLNAVLSAATGYFYFKSHAPAKVAADRPASARPVPDGKGATGIESQQGVKWSQVESDDYPTYIANLRKAGCPEPTIQKIVTGELHDIYAGKRRELEAQAAKLDQPGSGGTPAARQALAQRMQGLQLEENNVVASLLGVNLAGGPVVANAAAPSAASNNTPGSGNPSIPPKVQWPLAFQPVDPAVNPLNVAQQASLSQLQNKFISDIGGPNQNPQDPGYVSRWLQSQNLSDELFRTLYGSQAYMSLINQAARSAQQQAGNR